MLVYQLDAATRVGISCYHVRRKDVAHVLVIVLRLQPECQRITDRDCGGRTSLVQDQKADSIVDRVLGRQVFDGNGAARPVNVIETSLRTKAICSYPSREDSRAVRLSFRQAACEQLSFKGYSKTCLFSTYGISARITVKLVGYRTCFRLSKPT